MGVGYFWPGFSSADIFSEVVESFEDRILVVCGGSRPESIDNDVQCAMCGGKWEESIIAHSQQQPVALYFRILFFASEFG